MSKIGKKQVKFCGIAIQIVMLPCVGGFGALGLSSFLLALVVGFSSNTIGMDAQILDFIITTPATLFLFYGIALLIVAVVGCFAALTANLWLTAAYVLLGIVLMIYDATFGIDIFFGHNSYNEFIERMRESENGYSVREANSTGIIPIPPSVFWHHLQKRGKCCGMYSYEEWKNTTFGRKSFSIPDSCCNDEYDYEGCGELFWKHPDSPMHTAASMVNQRGCLTLFPEGLREDPNGTIDRYGKFIASLLLISVCLGFVLIALVASKKFNPAEGLNNPSCFQAPPMSATVAPAPIPESDEENPDTSNNNSPKPKPKRPSAGSNDSVRHVRTA